MITNTRMKPAAEKATAAWQRSSSSSADCSRSFLLNRPSSFEYFKKKMCSKRRSTSSSVRFVFYLGLRLVDIHAWVYSPLALNNLGGNGSDVTCPSHFIILLLAFDFHCWSRCIWTISSSSSSRLAVIYMKASTLYLLQGGLPRW